MKKISLSILAIVFAGASIMASSHATEKKAKQVTCSFCSKEKCTSKAMCTDMTNCVCK